MRQPRGNAPATTGIQCRFYTRGTQAGAGALRSVQTPLLWPHQPGGTEQCPARWCSVNAGLQDGQMREGIGLPTGRRQTSDPPREGAGGNTGLSLGSGRPCRDPPPGQVQPPHQSLASRVRRPRTQVSCLCPCPLLPHPSVGDQHGQLPGRVGEGSQRAQSQGPQQ